MQTEVVNATGSRRLRERLKRLVLEIETNPYHDPFPRRTIGSVDLAKYQTNAKLDLEGALRDLVKLAR